MSIPCREYVFVLTVPINYNSRPVNIRWPCIVSIAEASIGSGIAVYIGVHDIPGTLQIVNPLELDGEVAGVDAKQSPWHGHVELSALHPIGRGA